LSGSEPRQAIVFTDLTIHTLLGVGDDVVARSAAHGLDEAIAPPPPAPRRQG
jgi:hypothetical protein